MSKMLSVLNITNCSEEEGAPSLMETKEPRPYTTPWLRWHAIQFFLVALEISSHALLAMNGLSAAQLQPAASCSSAKKLRLEASSRSAQVSRSR